MTQPPGPPGGHDATQSFPAGGAPPPPPPDPVAPDRAPVDPGAAPAYGAQGPFPVPGPDVTHVAPAPPPAGYGYGPAAPAPAPTHGPPAGPRPAAPRRGRILVRALLVLLVIGALAGTTAWGFVNRSSAQDWKERSERAEADLRESLERVEVTTAELEDAEARLRELATENAGETDRNRILSDIVAQAPEVTAALADCQQETTALANDIIAAFGDPAADVTDLQARTDEVNEICASALEQAEALEAAIDGLGI